MLYVRDADTNMTLHKKEFLKPEVNDFDLKFMLLPIIP